MLNLFIGRKRELKLLNDLFQKRSASLVVMKGRRRIGKSRLSQEFAKNVPHYIFSGIPPTANISATDQREEFARQLHRKMNIPLPRADDWSDLFWLLAERIQKGKTVLVFDEIS
ncbi:MAG TPA: hypothetical protein VGZ69_03410 [Candidatus Rhabdochlamydia sp.]|jgi:uncharacterized protein|nr:hypothetical protein [Candidatus Rhabdochlamydia sp.]